MTLARHLMVDFNQMKAFVEDPLVLDRGAGIRVTDTAGRTYIDGLSGVFTTSLGHANQEIIDAVTAQLGRLAFGAPTMATTSTALALVDRILEFAPPPYTTMKFLSGGSEATESAMKLARQYHRQTGQPGRYKILSHYRGYHGGTGHALAASGWPTWKIPFEPMAPGFVHLQTPDPRQSPDPGRRSRDSRSALPRAGQPGDRVRGAGQRGGDHHRADPDVRRHRRAAQFLPPRPPRAVRSPRDPADLRRDHHRVRPDRDVVRGRTLGGVARHHLLRQGGDRRLQPACRSCS